HTRRKPRQRAGKCCGADLQGIDTNDVGTGCAENLERGDAAAPRFEVRSDAAADADPGNRQSGEADERQELTHSADEPLCAGRGSLARANVIARLRPAGDDRLLDFGRVVAAAETDPRL